VERAIARIPSHLISNAHLDSSAGSVESFASIGLTKRGIELMAMERLALFFRSSARGCRVSGKYSERHLYTLVSFR